MGGREIESGNLIGTAPCWHPKGDNFVVINVYCYCVYRVMNLKALIRIPKTNNTD